MTSAPFARLTSACARPRCARAITFRAGVNFNAFLGRKRRRPMLQPITFTVQRPLISLSTAAALANQSTGELLLRLEDGSIRYAFDVATPNASRRAVRILARSLADYLAGAELVRHESPQELPDVVASMFPALAEAIRTETLSRILDCDGDHTLDLVRAGCVQVVNQFRRGQGGTALIARRSCEGFLIGRRLVS